MKLIDRIYKLLISLKLAIFSFVSIMAVSAAGTIYESLYDSYHAREIIYRSWIFYFLLALLAINLTCVMISRWPWKKKHTPFVMAHIGILTLLLGSLMTQISGLDASLVLPIEGKERFVLLPERRILIYSSFGSGNYTLMQEERVNFIRKDPKRKPHEIFLGGKRLKVLRYAPFVLVSERVEPSLKKTNSHAVQFVLDSQRGRVSRWIYKNFLRKEEVFDLGPLKVILREGPYDIKKETALTLKLLQGRKVLVEVFRKGERIKRKILKEKGELSLGLMDLKLKVNQILERAQKRWQVEEVKAPSDNTTSGIQVLFEGKKMWIPLNSLIRVFDEKTAYVVSYSNLRKDLGFDVNLKDFKMKHYPGTNRASHYESLVEVKGETHTISMNEPLKYEGFTFYQSSFQKDEWGNLVASILTVNKDPGRYIKYLGSFLIVLGSLLLILRKWRKKI